MKSLLFGTVLLVGTLLQAKQIEMSIANNYDAAIKVTYRAAEQYKFSLELVIESLKKEHIALLISDAIPMANALIKLLVHFKISCGAMEWEMTRDFINFIKEISDDASHHNFALHVSKKDDGQMAVDFKRCRSFTTLSAEAAPAEKKPYCSCMKGSRKTGVSSTRCVRFAPCRTDRFFNGNDKPSRYYRETNTSAT